jgi:ATP-binding cassette subfamily B protein RaxB
MSIQDALSFGFRRRLPLVYQTEIAECGLACIGMVSAYHGRRLDMFTLRRRFSLSLKGVTLASVLDMARQLNLEGRAVKVELANLRFLKAPCILHWDFAHFVVLKEARAGFIVIHDPALGVRRLSTEEASRHFTGVALELWPGKSFEPAREPDHAFRWRELIGNVRGLFASAGQVFVLAVTLEIFTILSPVFLQWTLDHVIASADYSLLSTLAVGFGLLLILRVMTLLARSWALMYLGTSLNVQWRANVFAHLMRLPIQYFEKRHVTDITSRLNGIERIQDGFTTSFMSAFLDGLMAIVTAAVLLIYSPTLAAISFFGLALYGSAMFCIYGSFVRASKEKIIHAAKQQGHLLESVRAIKSIKLFQRETVRQAGWLALLAEEINAGLRTQKLQSILDASRVLCLGLAHVTVITLGALAVFRNELTVGALVAFVSYKLMFEDRSATLADKYLAVRMLKLWGERLTDIVHTPAEPAAADRPVSAEPPRASIEATDLKFRYSDYDRFILDGVSFRIEPGESVAITGPSGCGKTTLVHMILGVLPPTAGRLAIGGCDLADLGPHALREMIGAVLQDDALVSGSLADNISYFDPQPDQGWIEECARMASVHADIMAMPMRYGSLVGEMGTILSGGQKQRVLLARALYKRPRILVLDEATSHLDIERERAVNEAIRALRITRIIVAHRPETLDTADRCITLASGRIVSANTRGRPSFAAEA